VRFHAEKAALPGAVPAVAWVVVDECYRLHAEASTYLEGLRGQSRSVNTERNYAYRLALYLTWCDERGLDWADPGFENLLRFRDWLVSTPLPPRGKKPSVRPRFRKDSSADAVLVTMTEFLRFGAGRGWVSAKVAESLTQPRHLRFLPTDFETGEGGRFRQVQTRTLRFKTGEPGIECFTPEQVQVMVQLARNARDRFMIVLMRATGMRIGETLGMRREDVHLLADSRTLGCHVRGSHVHVHRRRDNVNGALAKSNRSRVIPVTDEVAGHYRDYQWERDKVPAAGESDMVFVNLYRAPLGRPMSYPNAKQVFDRLAKSAEITARPHMLRHTAATEWVAEGVPHDVVQALLGQVSPSSLRPYLHTSDKRKREAVERVAAGAR